MSERDQGSNDKTSDEAWFLRRVRDTLAPPFTEKSIQECVRNALDMIGDRLIGLGTQSAETRPSMDIAFCPACDKEWTRKDDDEAFAHARYLAECKASGTEPNPNHRPTPRSATERTVEALQKIASDTPRQESSIHGPRLRCWHCGHAWVISTKEPEHHGDRCAYVIATNALSDRKAKP